MFACILSILIKKLSLLRWQFCGSCKTEPIEYVCLFSLSKKRNILIFSGKRVTHQICTVIFIIFLHILLNIFSQIQCFYAFLSYESFIIISDTCSPLSVSNRFLYASSFFLLCQYRWNYFYFTVLSVVLWVVFVFL